MLDAPPNSIVLTGFFTSQDWLIGKTLSDLESILGYGSGRLTSKGASVYAFTRLPENWEFEVRGYTNVSGGLKMSEEWQKAEAQAEAYYKNTGLRDANTRLKDNARASMAVIGRKRLVKVKPILFDPNDPYPPGKGIQQWIISKLAEDKRSLSGTLLVCIKPGEKYPIP